MRAARVADRRHEVRPLRDRLARRDPVAGEREALGKPRRSCPGLARGLAGLSTVAGAALAARLEEAPDPRDLPGEEPREERQRPCRRGPRGPSGASVIQRWGRERGGSATRTRIRPGRSRVERVQKIVRPQATCFSQKARKSSRSWRCVTTDRRGRTRAGRRGRATASAKAVSSPELDSGKRAGPTASRRYTIAIVGMLRFSPARPADPLGVIEEVVELAEAARPAVDDAVRRRPRSTDPTRRARGRARASPSARRRRRRGRRASSPAVASIPALRAPPALRRAGVDEHARAGLARDGRRGVGRGVVDDQDLERRLALGERGGDRVRHGPLGVPAGNDHAGAHEPISLSRRIAADPRIQASRASRRSGVPAGTAGTAVTRIR